jgi:pimeloyl-ACP methyl ester carboxylesterase
MRAALPNHDGVVDRDGVKLHYEIYGDGPETILFIPTWMFVHSRSYKAQIPYFSGQYRCITWDPRGNGKSDRPTNPEAYGQGQYVGDALAILDATDTKLAIVFGYSQSGPTCAILAAYHRDRVKAVVTVGTHTPLVQRFEHNSEDAYNSIVKNPKGWEKYNRNYWQTNLEDFAEFFSEQLFVEPHSTIQREDVRNWSEGTTGKILAASMAAPYAGQYALDKAAYQRIACPMLVVHGRLDPIAPLAASEKIAELTGCDLLIFDQAGHAPHARYPAKFNLSMRNFLARHFTQRRSLEDA